MPTVKRYRVVNEEGVTLLVTLQQSGAHSELARQAEFGGQSEVYCEDLSLIGSFGYGYTQKLLWQDGEVSAAWEFAGTIQPLPEPASTLLTTIFWSDDPSSFRVVGGTLLLARVIRCERTIVARDWRHRPGGCQPPRIEELRLVLDNGSRPTWFAASAGYDGGYLYRLALTYDDAVAEFDGQHVELQDLRRKPGG